MSITLPIGLMISGLILLVQGLDGIIAHLRWRRSLRLLSRQLALHVEGAA